MRNLKNSRNSINPKHSINLITKLYVYLYNKKIRIVIKNENTFCARRVDLSKIKIVYIKWINNSHQADLN